LPPAYGRLSSHQTGYVKLLLTADLHFHRPWYEWLLDHGPHYDMVAIAGDLMEQHYPGGMVPQLYYLHDWIQAMVKRKAVLAICSGNHDLPSTAPLVVPRVGLPKEKMRLLEDYAKQDHWLQALRRDRQVTVDQDHRIVRSAHGEAMMVSCVAYRADGRFLVREQFPPPWLLLHHEPPAATKLAAPKAGNAGLSAFIRVTPPRYILSGHVHFTEGAENAFYERVGGAHCFNCRQHSTTGPRPDVPNVVILDTVSSQATWRRITETGEVVDVSMDLEN